MIPKILHQIWLGPYRIPKREQECHNAIKRQHPTWECNLWKDADTVGLGMPERTKLAFDYWGKQGNYVGQSDILRLFLVKEFGGVYMDIDMEPRQGFEGIDLSKASSFFCWHDTDDVVATFPNTTFGSAKNSKIFTYFNDNIRDPGQWHSPSDLARMVKSYFGVEGAIRHLGDDGILKYFERENSHMMPWEDFHNKHFFHHSLYSWDSNNKAKFERGDYE